MMPQVWADWLAQQAANRERDGLTRRLGPRQVDDQTIDLASNDYLGLSTHPEVVAAAERAAHAWGTSARASRLVTGTTQLHVDLEAALAQLTGQPAALVFSSGYAANTGLIPAVADAETTVISDAHVHASLIDGCRLSRARVSVTPHLDVAAVEDALAQAGEARKLVLTESIFSVLGDAAPLPQLAEICQRHDALLVVDEAHGLGVRGDGGGLVKEFGLNGHPNVILTATLSKSLGSQGGAVLAPQAVLDHLVNTSRSFIYDTGLAPPAAAAALVASRLLNRELIDRLHQRRDDLAEALGVTRPAGAVISVPMPSPQAALAAQADCLAAGVKVGCFRPPSVPDGISRLRVTVTAGMDDSVWAGACTSIKKAVATHR
ncbi:MAG TPA: 8-amino-7-oxononanoate synthase [Marmoricola sp.]|nr:8-amino-7-oxononanoate synthase [Marmoricola sp.]